MLSEANAPLALVVQSKNLTGPRLNIDKYQLRFMKVYQKSFKAKAMLYKIKFEIWPEIFPPFLKV